MFKHDDSCEADWGMEGQESPCRCGERAGREVWWVIEQAELLTALRRCSEGEDPDVMLLELTANSDVKTVDRSEEEER